MLRILTSIVIVSMVSSPTWAAEKKPSPLKIQNNDAQAQVDDKPLPLFTKFETKGEQVAVSPSAAPKEAQKESAAPSVAVPKEAQKESADLSAAAKEVQEAQNEPADSEKQPQKPNKVSKLKAVKTEVKSEVKPEVKQQAKPELNEAKLEQGAALAFPEAVVTNTDSQQAVSEAEHNTQDKVAANEKTQDLQVVDFVLTNQVVNREPKEALENFAAGTERGVAFVRLKAKADTDVTFVWYRNDKEYTRYKTEVHPGKQWRTFSSVKLRPGDWKVQLLGENKEVLAEKTFSVE